MENEKNTALLVEIRDLLKEQNRLIGEIRGDNAVAASQWANKSADLNETMVSETRRMEDASNRTHRRLMWLVAAVLATGGLVLLMQFRSIFRMLGML